MVEGDVVNAPRSATVAVPAPVLEQLESHGLKVTRILDDVEDLLHRQVRSSQAFVDRAANYLIAAGGKRFRPLLVALTAHLGDADARGIVEAGAIVELVHLATLYHDDVIDEAPARRGAPSANARWDNTVAILTGDYLFARASELSADLGVEVTRIMARTLAALCEGQILEVQGSDGALPDDVPRLEPTVDHYLQVVKGKTASLIATSCRYGALLSGRDEHHVETVTRYGHDVGMAFQLSDDLLDIASDHEDSGKTPGTDLLEGVRTLPVLLALQDAPDGELADLLDGAVDPDDLPRALRLLRESPGMEAAREVAADYVISAIGHLDELGDGPAVSALHGLAGFALERVG
jgi:heptaprenyl diphosphate synthase